MTETLRTDYYVYAYLRQRDSKKASAGTPYYIGKGQGNRIHEKIGHPYNKSILNQISGASRRNVVMIRWIFKNFEDEENWRKNSVPKLIAAYNELFGAWDVDYKKFRESLVDDWGLTRHHTFMPELSSPRE